jgi:Holliday junction resolvase
MRVNRLEEVLEGQRMFRRRDGEDYEVDAIAVCGGEVFMIEARSTPRSSDVREIKDKGERFFEFFPEFKGKRLVVIFGSITFPENVIRYATRAGVYVMGWREWEYIDILNFKDVKKKRRSAK